MRRAWAALLAMPILALSAAAWAGDAAVRSPLADEPPDVPSTAVSGVAGPRLTWLGYPRRVPPACPGTRRP
jgi:hypothetical protein